MRLNLSATVTIFWAEEGIRTLDPNLGKVMLYQLSYFRKILQSQACRTPQTYDSVSEDKAQLRYDSFVKDHYYIYNFVPPQGFEPWPADPCSDMLIHYTTEAFGVG